MVKPEDLLQERLERLEAGETLTDLLDGVPEAIAVSLRTAARLSALVPARKPGIGICPTVYCMDAAQKKSAYQRG
jgi:hypothetical protein